MPTIQITITKKQEDYLKKRYQVESLDLTISQIFNDLINNLVDKEYTPTKTVDDKITEINNKIK
jgi:hypothetical protein